MNIIVSGFFHPIVGIVTGLLLLFGTEYTGKIILKKFISPFFFINFTFGLILVSLINFVFILVGWAELTSRISTSVLLILGCYNFYFFLKNYKLFKVIFPEMYFILLILILLFILSVSPPTMADALHYHLGVPNFIKQNHQWPDPNMWLHANISGLGEVYNFLGLNVNSDIVGSLSQFFALASFLYFFTNKIQSNINKILFNLFILSSPVIIFLLSGAKFLILPQLITTLVLYFIVSKKKLNINLFFIIIILLCGAANMKTNFLISCTVLGLLVLAKIQITSNICVKLFFIFLLFFLPRAIFNYLNIDEFEIFDIIAVVTPEFISYLKNYKESNYVFPFNFFIPDSLNKITTILGIQIFLFFFIKNPTKQNIQIFIVSIVVTFLYFFLIQLEARMFFEILLWLSLLFVFSANFKVSLENIKSFLIVNTLPILIILIYGTYSLAPALISNNSRNEVMKKNAHEYNAANWINEKYEKDKIILTNLHSVSLINNPVIPMSYLLGPPRDKYLERFISFLGKKKIDYLILRNESNNIYDIFSSCKEIIRNKSPMFNTETRNPLNRKEKYFIMVIEFENNNLKNCIKKK